MSYEVAHRVLLRALLARGVIPLPEAEQLMRQHGEDDIRCTVKTINEMIRPFQQSVKLTTDELRNEQALVFLSLGLDDITKAQTVFSQAELQYFRVLLEQIVTTERRQLSGIAALNLVTTMKVTLSKHDAEKLLSTWCSMRYLDKTEGLYSLGLRSVHEFEGYLRRNMPDAMEECTLCKQIVFRGCNCPACGVAVHTRCLTKYLEKLTNWPCCKAEYTGMPQADDTTLTRTRGNPVTRDEMPATSQDMAGTSQVYESVQSASQIYDAEDRTDTFLSQESIDEDGLTQASQLGISQTSTVRKRKRQWL